MPKYLCSPLFSGRRTHRNSNSDLVWSRYVQLFYTVFYSLGFIVLSPLFLYKMWKRGKYRENFLQRFGCYSPELRAKLAGKTHSRCWIQAVSVGEINLALLLIPALRARLPQVQLIVTTTTSTGYALARERLPQDVTLLYFPQDFPPCVRRAYSLIQPDFIVLMETELWPNHVWLGARRGIPLFLVNARMSPRSARRYQRLRALFHTVVNKLSLVCAQSQDDATNFSSLGVSPDRVKMTGNMKYDASLPKPGGKQINTREILTGIGVSPEQLVLVAGSTHPGEEEILFDLVNRLRVKFPTLFLILVPRHVERTPDVVRIARAKGVNFLLRTDVPARPAHAASPDCLIVNTTGELRWFYDVATVVFVGKSLVGEGGQNIIEPAATGVPVVFGPNMQNFKAIAAEFVAAGAGVQVADVAALEHELADLLTNAARRKKIAAAARAVIDQNVGATQRNVELIERALRVTE